MYVHISSSQQNIPVSYAFLTIMLPGKEKRRAEEGVESIENREVKLTKVVSIGQTIKQQQNINSRVVLRCIWFWRFVEVVELLGCMDGEE